jgi:hypothetical protein
MILGYALLAFVLATLAATFWTSVDASHRELVVRLAVALMMAVVLVHLGSALREICEEVWPSGTERAARCARPPRTIDPHFGRLYDDFRHASGSYSYFERLLWPRLVELADGLESGAGKDLPKPPGRPLRRGPSLDALAALVGRLERLG